MFGFTVSFLEVASYLGMILVLSVYWTADRVHFERLWLSLLPVDYRGRARSIWREIELNIGAYIRSELVQSLLAGVLLGVGYWLLGLKYPVLLAMIGTIAWFVPVLGTFLALIPVIWVGLTANLYITIGATLYTLLIFSILEWLIEPHFFNQRRFSGLLQLLIMIAFIEGVGVAGLLIAPPVAIAVQILFNQLLQQQIPLLAGKTVPELADLRKRVTDIKSMLVGNESEPSPRVASMLERLDELLDEADDMPFPEYPPKSVQQNSSVSVQVAQQPSH
jgi:predicted PurR-regulated permease PerM